MLVAGLKACLWGGDVLLLFTKFLNILAEFYKDAAVMVLAISIFLLFRAIIAAFASIRSLQINRFRIVLGATTLIYLLCTSSVCPSLASHITPLTYTGLMLLSIPLNAFVGLISSFAYDDCRKLEVVAFWISVGIVLDAIALVMNVDLCSTFERLYSRCRVYVGC